MAVCVYGVKADVVKALATVGNIFHRNAVLTYPSNARFVRWWAQDDDSLEQDPSTKEGQDVWKGSVTGLVWSIRDDAPPGTALPVVPGAPPAFSVPSTRNVLAGAGLAGGGPLTNDVTLLLPAVIAPGTYGDAAHYVTVTVDTYGRVVALTPTVLPASGVTSFNTRTGAVTLTTADVSAVLPSDVALTDRVGGNTFTTGPQTFQAAAPSAPGTGSGSECWGLNATAASGASSATVVGNGSAATSSASSCVIVGNGSTCSKSNSIVLGAGSVMSGASSIIIGNGLACTINSSIIIGNSATISALGVVIGSGAGSSAIYGISLGMGTTVSHVGAACIGGGISSSRQRELVIGNDTGNGAGAWTSGHRIRLQSTTSTNALQDLGSLDFNWTVATDASRTSQLDVQLINNASVLTTALQADFGATSGDMGLMLWDLTAGSLVRVSRGAADSGGTGFRLLRVPN